MKKVLQMLWMTWAVTVLAAEIRYDDVLYLDEAKQAALELKVLQRTPLAFTRDPNSVIAHLAAGQRVRLLGIGEKYHYVLAQIVTGPARGWLDASVLEALPEELRADLQKRRERRLANRALIERHEVALEMTSQEVLASLGKPDRKAQSHTSRGDEEQWYYVAYKLLPQYSYYSNDRGELLPSVSYRRTTAGYRMIAFRDDQVVEIASDVEERRPSPDALVLPDPSLITH